MKTKSVLIRVLIFLLIVGPLAFYCYEQRLFDQYITSQQADEMRLPVNEQAPVVARAELLIEAPVDRVWEVLTAIDRWPEWQSEVEQAQLQGPLRAGAKFNWRAGGLDFQSEIRTYEPQTAFGWTGRTWGAYAVHNWYFEACDGVTNVEIAESLQGFFPKLFRKKFQQSLEEGVNKNLQELKTAAAKFKKQTG